MESYAGLSSGQNYTDIVLNVYKSYNMKAVLSSFEHFNVNLTSFQQNSWMANIAGAPLWTQSGCCVHVQVRLSCSLRLLHLPRKIIDCI